MLHRTQVKELTSSRKSALLTLAIAALIHETDEAVQETAVRLMERYPDAVIKSLLKPLSQTPKALDCIIDDVVYPIQEKVIGKVILNDYEAEIIVSYRGYLDYTTDQIAELVATRFVQRGILVGRIYLTMIHPHYRYDYKTSVDLATYSRYSRVEHEQVA